jgi:lantibiotic biosynthesis protein
MIEIISKIEEKIFNSIINENRIGLLDGLSGIALFYSYLNQAFENEDYQEKLLVLIDKTNNLISDKINKSSLCSGLSGYGWMLLKLKSKDIEIDEEYFKNIDTILLDDFKDLSHKNNYDFLHGSMGITLYFIERNKSNRNDFLNTLLNDFSKDLINKISSNLKDVITKDSALNQGKIYYFGIAHGISGIINFLTYLAENFKELKFDIKDSLKICIDFLKDYKKYDFVSKQFYPNVFLLNTKTTASCRLGWCQGDLGIANSLYNAGLFLNDNSLQKEAIELVEYTKNISFEESMAKDIGICHGSVGILIQYFLASVKFKIDYSDKIEYWYTKVKEQTNNFEDFLAHKGDGNYYDDVSILNGASGLGLVLMTIENKISMDWLDCINLH